MAAVIISATKDGVKFTTSGDVGTANITVRQNSTAEKVNCSFQQKGPARG
jgi:proliferating cell nuclear antigen